MSNVCECKEEIEFKLEDGQPTLMDLYREMNKLRLENEMLKVENKELHNKLSIDGYDETLFEGNNPNDEYSEDELANAYAMADKEFKFV